MKRTSGRIPAWRDRGAIVAIVAIATSGDRGDALCGARRRRSLWVTGWLARARRVADVLYKFPRRQVFQRAASQPPSGAIVVHAIRSRVKSTPGPGRHREDSLSYAGRRGKPFATGEGG